MHGYGSWDLIKIIFTQPAITELLMDYTEIISQWKFTLERKKKKNPQLNCSRLKLIPADIYK